MKKIITVLALSLLLVGCGNKSTMVSNRSTALIKVGSQTITAGQVYSALLSQDAAGAVKDMATLIVLNKEVAVTDEMKTKADAQLADFTTNVGDNVDLYLNYYGYKDLDEYYAKGILPTLQQDALVKTYLTDNYDSLAAETLPKLARVIEVTDAALAESALAEIKAGADFATVAAKYSTSSYPGSEELVYNSSDLPEVVLVWMNLQTTPTLSTVIPDTTNATNYIVQVTAADAVKLKDQVIANYAVDTTFVDKAIKAAFVKNGFTIYDKTIYDAFVVSYADYLAK